MAYVVVILAMVNAAAVAGFTWWLVRLAREYPIIVETAIVDEIRKQDDRIEKRLQRAQGQAQDTVETGELEHNGIQAGRPVRRSR